MSRKGKDKPDFSDKPRFPVKRLVWNVVRGNMIFSGGLYCIAILGEILDEIAMHIFYGGPWKISESIVKLNSEMIIGAVTDGLAMNLLLSSGSIIGLVWYIVARQIETRHAKKRWLVYVKSRETEVT